MKEKHLGLLDVFCIASGAMISSGIFILPGLAFAQSGPCVFLAYLAAAFLALTGAFSIAELTSAMPRSGGDYFFITRSLGPLFGTVSGVLSWLALLLKTSFAIIGIAEIANLSLGLDVHATAIVTCFVFTIINLVGVKEAAKLETVVVLFLLLIMFVYLAFGFPSVEPEHFKPFCKNGFNSILVTAGLVFVSYGGLLKIASISEDVENPSRNIPLGLFLSLFVVGLLYTFMTFVAVGTMDASQLAGSLSPMADSARIFMGKSGYILLSAAAILAFISTANAGIMAASKYPYALSRDNLLPGLLSRYSPKRATPYVSVILTGLMICASFFLELKFLVKAASTVVLMTYILSQFSIIILRHSRLQNYRPTFKAPFFPWIQWISIVIFFMLILDMGLQVILICLSMTMFSAFFYTIYGRKKASHQYAMLHILEKVVDRCFVTHDLEKELKEIISERDSIQFDRFDKLVDEAVFIDANDINTKNELFELISAEMSQVLGMKKKDVSELLHKREDEATTAITPFVAIPHIVIDKEGVFELTIIRCNKGIKFTEKITEVKAVFVLAGSRDERTFHLQTLSAIAQIVMTKDFQDSWLKADTISHLKDIIHLTERKRLHH